VPLRSRLPNISRFVAAALAALIGLGGLTKARAEALLLIDVDSGKVLHAENATYPWYPASVTKLMTIYLTLRAVKEGRVTFDTLLTVSSNAVAQQPTKMGFPLGTQVTIDNALKMLMVHSANDMAVLLAEGVGGSIEGFADQMNSNAERLGMVQTHYVNPNGLPAEEQITSARDLAIVARALIREFPEDSFYWHIPAIKFGKRVIRNTNNMLGRYPGIDGMKTGFICASGFNLVASANRNGKRLLAVVLGAPSPAVRSVKAAQLLERGFNSGPLSWLTPSLGTVESLTPISAAPADLHETTCGKHRRRPGAEEVDAENESSSGDSSSAHAFMLSNLQGPAAKPSMLLTEPSDPITPVVVYTGPTRPPGAQPVPDPVTPARPVARAKPKPSKIAAVPPHAAKPAAPAAASAKSGTAAAVPRRRPRPAAPPT
jgi:D-alanyl-D-alanine carboxypeptidase